MFELYLWWNYVQLRAVAVISSDFNPFILSNMATFRFELDHRPTRNKTYNLYLMVTVGKKRTKKKTGIQLKHIDDFNPSCKGNNWIRANMLDAKALNEQLRLMLVKAQETYNELEEDGEVSSAHIIKTMDKEIVSPSFLAFARERAKEIEEEGGFRNMRKYVGLCNKLDAFRKKMRMHDITMEDLTVEFLTKFNNFLHKWKNEKNPEKLLHPNTIEVQLNIFKTLVNRAINLGYMSADKNPFLKFSYKGVPTMKEKLEMAEIQRIINLDLPEGSLIWNVRNYFLFSFYCAGIRAADFIQLRWRNVSSEGRLTYSMDKNGKFRDIVLVPQALEILRHYFRPDAKPDDYIFPLLDNTAPYAKYVTTADKKTITPDMRKTLYAAVSAKNALINKYLKKIAEKAEISKNVSFHISRHSFAKVAKETGLDSGIVKELLAHSNLATTERYMGNFDTQKTDNALINLFGGVEKPKDKKEEVIEALKGMSPEEIAAILSAIKK